MRFLIALPLLIVIVFFALSNPQPVNVGIWPTGYRVETALSSAVLIGMAVAFLFGALLVWISELAQRRRARRAEQAARMLEEQLRELKAGASARALPPRVS